MEYKLGKFERPIIEPSREDWLRLACYIDGEGAILVNHMRKMRRTWLRVCVTNTDPRMPRWCAETFGGRLTYSDRRRSSNHRLATRWEISCASAGWVLEGCLAHFLIKREEAEIAIAFQKSLGGPGKLVTKEMLEYRESLRMQLRERKRATPLFNPEPVVYQPPKKTGPKPKSPLLENTSSIDEIVQ